MYFMNILIWKEHSSKSGHLLELIRYQRLQGMSNVPNFNLISALCV